MGINLVYDFFTNGYIPNGLNYRYLQHFIKNSFDSYICFENLSKDYNNQLPTVWWGDWMIFHRISEYSLSITDVNINNKNATYLYTISPFGGGSPSFGAHYSLNEGYTFLEFVSKKALNYIKTAPNFYLVINYTNEGVTDFDHFEYLYKDLKRLEIPHNKVIYASGDYNIHSLFNKWFDKRNVYTDKIKTLYANWSLPGKRQDFINHTNYATKKNIANIIIKNKLRPYKFLMFNRRIRSHRLYSIIYFHHIGIIDDMLISYDFLTDNDGGLNYHSDMERLFSGCGSDIKTTYENVMKNYPKRTVDIDDIFHVNGLGAKDSIQPYLDSYIHITSETSVFEGSGYFSEKTWKPIANLQPFIMMGSYKALYKLKEMGFKTFHPFINEEYDLIENNEDRFVMILKEIERLSKLSTEEIHKWYYSIQDVLLYNQRLFFDERTMNEYLHTIKKDILSMNGDTNIITNKVI
jgi:hypothetical protein